MNKYFTRVILLISTIIISAKAYAYDFMVDSMYFDIESIDEMTCAITYGDKEYTGELVIPEKVTYKGRTLTVTTIGSEAFSDCRGLISINIPNSVTTIGEGAFSACYGLTSINIPNSVTTIGSEAFSYCSGLTSINISNSVTTIGKYAFSDCYRLTSINIPNSVTTIGKYAFRGCYGLTSINIPNSVTTIGDHAFSYCSGLTSINISNSVTTIENSTFAVCSGLTSINIPNSVTTIGDGAFSSCSGLTSINIPNSVTTIGKYAFSACYGLTSINIPNSVTTIGDHAFSYCSRLTSINIPNSVTTIGVNICNRCTELIIGNGIKELPYSLDWDAPENYTLFAAYSNSKYGNDRVECSLSTLRIVDSKEPLPIPNTKIPNDGDHYFYGVPLKNIYIGRKLDYSTLSPFPDMSFDKIEFGGYCTQIEPCYSVDTLILGSNIQSVDANMIEELDSLSAIYIKSTTPPQLIGDFTRKVYLNTNLYVPIGSKSTYQNAEGWRNFWTIEETTDFSGMTSISDVRTQQPEITITSDGFTIKECDGAAVSVYSIDGKLLRTITDYQGEIIALSSGIYIVEVNGNCLKVKI